MIAQFHLSPLRHAELVSASIVPQSRMLNQDRWTLKQVQGDMVRCLVLASMLFLAGCNQSPYAKMSSEETAEMADIARVNGANALVKIDELESRVDELEEENKRQAQLISDLEGILRR
ncbi:MAG: hypothetical protein IPL18_06745 [Sphingomonadales bacterium]|nr:hypothetical protein [Sphingomonadales bacterium]